MDEEDDGMTSGEKLARLRKNTGLTQRGLAKMIGVSQQAIHQFETYKTTPSEETLINIADVLEVQIGELMTMDMNLEIDLKRYSKNLYRAVEKKDLSLSEVARRAGISLNTIYKIFDGKKAGRLDTFLAIANVLGADYNKLLEGVVKKDA